MTLVFILLCLSVFAFITYFLWIYAEFDWLAKICSALIISLPFERIPSISLGGSNLRVSQLLVIVGIWTASVLFIKQNSTLLGHTVNKLNYFLLAFIAFSTPSWFGITDIKRFWVTEIGTLLVFGALLLLSNFTKDIVMRTRDLVTTMFFVTIFGYFQFVGDLINLPTWITGLRETYTKIVFGIPRIQATAIEPLYFAGMLFVCLFLSLSYFFLDKELLHFKVLSFLRLEKASNYIINGSLFLFFFGAFLLTISKSAIVIFITMVPFFAFFLIHILQVNILAIVKKIWVTTLTVCIILLSVYWFIPSVRGIADNVGSNFVETIYGNSASSNERADFLKAFDNIIDKHYVLGIGSGHFGVEAGKTVETSTGAENYLIVNNVYLEVWLEHGLLPAVIFASMILLIIGMALRNTINQLHKDRTISCVRVSLIFTLIAYCFQWLTFSPIFIMPIFILMGLIVSDTGGRQEI